MVVDHADRHHGRLSVVADAGGLALEMILSDRRMDLTARQHSADRLMQDASNSIGRNDRCGTSSLVVQVRSPTNRK